jgi:hypothetical protein
VEQCRDGGCYHDVLQPSSHHQLMFNSSEKLTDTLTGVRHLHFDWQYLFNAGLSIHQIEGNGM